MRRTLGRWAAVALVAGLAGAGPVGAQAGDPLATPLQVQIVVWFEPSLGYMATVAYTTQVSPEQAKAELADLASRLGYTSLDQLRRTDYDKRELKPLLYETTSTGSQIGFRLDEKAIDRERGRFYLEAFVNAYRHYGRIDLDFLVGSVGQGAFEYRGIADFENAQVKVAHSGKGQNHSFRVLVKDPAGGEVTLPAFAPPADPLPAANPPVGKDSPSRRQMVALGFVGLGLAGLVFFFITRPRRPGAGRRGTGRPARRTVRRR